MKIQKCRVRTDASGGELKKSLLSTLSLLVLGAGGAYSASAHAQLEEVVVTAERRTQSLQDVPISLVAFDADAVEKMDFNELEDLGTNIPNVTTAETWGQATTVRAFIRGVGAVAVEVTQDPSVATYVDGIYVGSSHGGSVEASDLERIEILRGPQGTLYGRNATGGAINLISKKPELGEWRFAQSFTYGNLDKINAKTQVNIPLGDKLALRATGMLSKRDGWVENRGPGKDFGIEDRVVGRMALRYEPTSAFRIDWAADYSEIKDTTRYMQVLSGGAAAVAGTGDPLVFPLGPVTANLFFPDPVGRDRQEEAHPIFPVKKDDNQVFGTSLTMAWDATDHIELKSITGWRKVDANWFAMIGGTAYNELTAGPFPIGTFPLFSTGDYFNDFKQLSQELQMIGDVSSGIGNLDYAVGAYFYHDEANNGNSSASFSGQPLTRFTLTDNESFAVFSQATFNPAGTRLDLTLGLRHTWDHRQARNFDPNTTPPIDGIRYDRKFDNFSPAFTAAYNFADGLNVYGKVVTGYRSGGTSVFSEIVPLFQQGADPETIISYEIGFKSDFLQDRVRLNAAAFLMDYKDYQASLETGSLPSRRDILNVGGVTIKGVESELLAAITPDLTFNASVGYLDTEFDEAVVDPGTGAPPSRLTDRLPFAPKVSYTVGLDYIRELSRGIEIGANIDFSYQGDKESTYLVDNASRTIDARSILNAGFYVANVPLGQGTVKLRVWGKNLTDEEYLTDNIGSMTGFGASELASFGDPRTFGVTLSYNYN